MANRSDPPRSRALPIRYEGAAALGVVSVGGLAPFDDEGFGAEGVVVVGDGGGDSTVDGDCGGDWAVVGVGAADDGVGDLAVVGVGAVDDGDGAGEEDGTLPVLFEVAAETLTVSFMPPAQ